MSSACAEGPDRRVAEKGPPVEAQPGAIAPAHEAQPGAIAPAHEAPPAPHPPAQVLEALAEPEGNAPAAEPGARPEAPGAPDAGGGAEKRESPVSLTASDGTGLQIVSLRASGVVQEPLAFTELAITFRNPEPRTTEGQFRITLPIGASVSRFAMKIAETWQEGEVVERQAARRAYEDFLHRRQDPALLEQGAGNEFTARVFPIPANGIKELIISYSQELASSDQGYRIPLVGLPQLERLSIRVLAGEENRAVTMEQVRWVPNADFELPPAHAKGRLGVRSDDLLVARIQPIVDPEPEPIESLLMLIDTSASRALGFQRQISLARRLIRELRPEVQVSIACFDQNVQPIYEGAASRVGESEFRKVLERRALGASDLQLALLWARDHLARAGAQRYRRVLLITDGVITAGASGSEALQQAVRNLKAVGVERLDAIAVGGIRDEASLARLVTASLPRNGAVIDGERAIESITRRLASATHPKIKVTVDDAIWFWPRELNGLQAGDQVLVYAQLPREKRFRISLGGAPLSIEDRTLAQAERPLVERAWAKARIADLIAEREGVASNATRDRVALEKEIVALSTRHRVLSPFTALLVLETAADYARFRVDRRALSDILTVEENGLAVLSRRAPNATPPPSAQQQSAQQQSAQQQSAQQQSAQQQSARTGKKEPAPPPARRRTRSWPTRSKSAPR